MKEPFGKYPDSLVMMISLLRGHRRDCTVPRHHHCKERAGIKKNDLNDLPYFLGEEIW
jgi:hypothetical protein